MSISTANLPLCSLLSTLTFFFSTLCPVRVKVDFIFTPLVTFWPQCLSGCWVVAVCLVLTFRPQCLCGCWVAAVCLVLSPDPLRATSNVTTKSLYGLTADRCCHHRLASFHEVSVSLLTAFLGRVSWVDLIKWVSNVRSYVHTYIWLSPKSYLNFNKIWHVGRDR